MILNFKIPNNGEFRLGFDGEPERFTMSSFMYINEECQIQIYEDYLYIFVADMLGSVEKPPRMKESNLFGELGRWQEFYCFEESYIKKHTNEIEMMEKATFVSGENYGTFLYEFSDEVWIEINRGYDCRKKSTPMEFYSNASNFRVLLAPVSKDALFDWGEKLKWIKEKMA